MTPMDVRLRSRPLVRGGWGIVAAASLVIAGVGVWAGLTSLVSRPVAALVSFGLAALYAPACVAGARMAMAPHPRVRIVDGRIEVHHPAVLGAPIVAEPDGYVADTRSPRDRRIAATVRRGGIVAPDFLDPTIPVISAAPSSHSDHGTAQAPNLVVFFREPAPSPRVSLAVRALLRISTGRTGRYRGPRTRRPIEAVRLVADDPAKAAAALRTVCDELVRPRNDRYLATIVDRDLSKARRHRLMLAAVVVGVAAIVVLAAMARGV